MILPLGLWNLDIVDVHRLFGNSFVQVFLRVLAFGDKVRSDWDRMPGFEDRHTPFEHLQPLFKVGRC